MLDWVGDGYCDDDANNEECDYDSGDCCGPNINIGYCSECLCFGLGGSSSYGITMPPTRTIDGNSLNEKKSNKKKHYKVACS